MTSAKDLKAGAYIKYNNDVYKVTRKEVVTCGTHCHSKTKLFIQGLYSKGEKAINLNHNDNIDEVDIMRKAGQVVSKGQGKVQVMDNISFETIDATAEPELFASLNEGDAVTFITIEGSTMVLDKRGN